MAIVPTPKQARYLNTMILAGRVALVTPRPQDLRIGREQMFEAFKGKVEIVTDIAAVPRDADTIVLIGGPGRNPSASPFIQELSLRLPSDKGKEGYLLSVGVGKGGKNIIVAAGNSPQADFWALQSLRQICYAKEGNVYVAEVQITDWPTLELRGSKRPQFWESAFKANLRYENWISPKYADYYMTEWIGGIHPMRPSRVLKVPSGTLDVSRQTLENVFVRLRGLVAAGATGIVVHVDDAPMRFSGGNFPNFESAMQYLLTQVHREMMRLDRNLKLYFIPQPYFIRKRQNVPKYTGYAANMMAAGGLPPGTAMNFCGHDITSAMYTGDMIDQYCRAFGATDTKALIYDNYLHRTGFRAVPKYHPSLARHIQGICPERGNAIVRATLYDWHWNPEAYDPDRSLKLVCRELAGLENWRRVYDVLALYDRMLPGEYVPRAQLLPHLEKLRAEYNRKLDALKADSAGIFKGRVKLPERPAMGGMAFNLARSMRRMEEESSGYPELRAVKLKRAPTVDGRCSEKAWDSAPAAAWGDSITLKACYDHKAVYFAMQWRAKPPSDCQFHLMLDPGHTGMQCMVFRATATGDAEDEFYDQATDSRPQGEAFKSGWKHASTVAENLWTVEMAVPMKDIRARVEVRDVWGIKAMFDWPGNAWGPTWGGGAPGYLNMRGAGNLVFGLAD